MTPHSANRQRISPEAGAISGRPPAADVAACTERLEALALRIVEFMRTQIAQFETLCGDFAGRAADQAEWEQMARELRDQRTLWEQEKFAQAEKIAAETQMLTAAWDEIEAERRRLMTDESNAASPESVMDPSPSAQHTPEPTSSGNLFDCGVLGSGQSAALQFHQIKRDIRQHARRQT